MTIPAHYLQVFDKPKVSSKFLRRYPVAGYKHRILANGGFDTASCTLLESRAEGQAIYENYVGNRVAVVVNNPFEPIFEGLISRITFTTPGLILTRSLEEMGNRVTVAATSAAAGNPVQTGAVNNLTSQAIYGIKTKVLRGARNAAGDGILTSLRARALNDLAYPMTSIAINDGSAKAIIELEIIGFFHVLEWENTAATGLKALRNGATGWVDVLLAGMVNGTTFIDTATTDLVNNAITYTGTSDGGTMWQKLVMLAECGNNAQTWIVGVGPYDPNTRTRRLYYRPADTMLKYLSRINYPGQLFTPQNTRIQPWNARPDGVVQVVDALVGWNGGTADPRLAYISIIEYNADTQRVSWQSQDNVQIEGALQVDKWHSTTDQKYGQRPTNPLM